jgi:hypothetical protein
VGKEAKIARIQKGLRANPKKKPHRYCQREPSKEKHVEPNSRI